MIMVACIKLFAVLVSVMAFAAEARAQFFEPAPVTVVEPKPNLPQLEGKHAKPTPSAQDFIQGHAPTEPGPTPAYPVSQLTAREAGYYLGYFLAFVVTISILGAALRFLGRIIGMRD